MVIVECMLILLHGCFSMSSSKSASHVVVAWEKKGEEAFENELVEAISLRSLSVHGKFSNLAGSQKLKYSETGYSSAQFLL